MTQQQQKQVLQRVNQIKKKNTILLKKLYIVKKQLQEKLKYHMYINGIVVNQQTQIIHQMRLMRQKLFQKRQALKKIKYETEIKKKYEQIRNGMLHINQPDQNSQSIDRFKRPNLRLNPQIQIQKKQNKRRLNTQEKKYYQCVQYIGKNLLNLKQTVTYYKAQQNAYMLEILPKQQFRYLHSNTSQSQQWEI